MKCVGLLKINVTCSKFGFFGKKVTIFRKNLKIDNYSYHIKNKTRQNKELKYRQKNIVCSAAGKSIAVKATGETGVGRSVAIDRFAKDLRGVSCGVGPGGRIGSSSTDTI